MQRKHFFCNKEEENKKNFRERSKDYIQLNSHSSKVSNVHKRIKKHLRQKISERHNSSYFYEWTVPLVPFNSKHMQKRNSHMRLIDFIDIYGGNPAFSWSAGFERFRQPPDLVSHWLVEFANVYLGRRVKCCRSVGDSPRSSLQENKAVWCAWSVTRHSCTSTEQRANAGIRLLNSFIPWHACRIKISHPATLRRGPVGGQVWRCPAPRAQFPPFPGNQV